MTISPQKRAHNIDIALRMMMEGLGDKSFSHCLFEVKDPRYSTIIRTTWAELEQSYFIQEDESTIGNIHYRLTGQGWIEGLRRTGQLRSEALRHKLIGFMTELKDEVKGRKDDQFVFVNDFAAKTKIAADWIINVVESRLLQREFLDLIVDLDWWSHNNRFYVIRIPVMFGMRRL